MKERLNSLPSEEGESFDSLKSDVRSPGRSLDELEELVEGYRTFAIHAQLTTRMDKATKRKVLHKTQKVVEPLPDAPSEDTGTQR